MWIIHLFFARAGLWAPVFSLGTIWFTANILQSFSNISTIAMNEHLYAEPDKVDLFALDLSLQKSSAEWRGEEQGKHSEHNFENN